MKFGIVLSAGGPREAAGLAADAETAGWDGVFTWDGVAIGTIDTFDPWIVMAAMAIRTTRVRLGALVTPPARRRPWKLAREVLTLDHLSNGRLVLPVGLGALDDGAFGNVGEPTAAKVRAELLDESLAIVEGLLSGEPFGFEGRHYRFEPMTFRPLPVQRPRVPVWVVAVTTSERSLARAFRWDGLVTQGVTAEDVRVLAARARPGFEIVVDGRTQAADRASLVRVAAMADAGATWWMEADWEGATVESIRARILAGPPGA
jgi:alkanesulfonate monooxygenase SsuD/methylene tetrahydromethanopterin reductase-like flavin-dependent oxidoreductase (luciferase family)